MDPFTEKLLERTRARRENLQKKMADRPTAGSRTAALNKRPLAETNLRPPVQAEEEKPCAKPSPSKRRCSDENKILGTENKEPKSPEIPKRTQPEIVACPQVKTTGQTPPGTNKEELKLNSEDHGAASMKTRMQRLAEQRKYWDDNASPPNSPPITNPPREVVPSPPKTQATEVNTATPMGRRTRLANLAATIGSWEDDSSQSSVKPNNTQEKPGTACLPKVSTASTASSSINSPTVRQEAVSQKPKEEPVKKATLPSRLVSTCPEPKPSSSAVANNFDNTSKPIADKATNVAPSKLKDEPAAQKEKPLPASVSSPQRVERPTSKVFTTFQGTPREEISRATPVVQKEKTATPVGGPGVKSFLERFGEKCQERSPAPVNTAPKSSLLTPTTKSIHERLLRQNEVSTTASLTQQQKKEREKELAAIRSRFEKGSARTADKDDAAKTKPQETQREIQAHPVTSSKPPKPNVISHPAAERTPDSPQQGTTSGSQQKMADHVKSPEKSVKPNSLPLVKQVSITEVKSDGDKVEEIREIEMNVDGSINETNSSEMINSIFSNAFENEENVDEVCTQQVKRFGDDTESNNRDESSDEGDDDDDALNISSMSLLTPLAETVGVGSPEALLSLSLSPSKVEAETSASFDSPKSVKFQRTRVPRAESKDSFRSIEENQNLLYSIDAYRSQRFKESERPPVVQTIVRKEDVASRIQDVKHASPRQVNIKQKLKIFNNEINLQQTVIHQASQALNCCVDEEHGKGTQTEAEAERLLLFATEKRASLLAEINKLKSEGPQKRPQPSAHESTPSRGLISISEIFLPIKPDFICSTSQRPDAANYYFFLIIRAGAENMVATPLASISSSMKGDALTFPTTFTLEDVSNDFGIHVDVYSLAQKKEGPALEKRKKAVKTKAITPKRLLTSITKSNVHTPVLASPGGPNAVRTSNFVLVGSHKLSLSSIGNSKFLLDKVPFLSPLEGHVCLKLKCQVNSFFEEKGFLTMFEDVSGFGAWHRRWCVLSGYCVSYWTYPDDEKRKNPIGRINLANCTSRKIEPANREFCARPNTIELITVRPQREGDRETLVSQCRDTLCVTKNWLCADTKEERNLWMQKLNQVIVDLRLWQPDACYRPTAKV